MVVPHWLGHTSALRVLDLSSNKLHGVIPPLSNCTELNVLNLWNNSLTGNLSTNFRNLPSLLVVVLSGNNLTGSFPQSLAYCTQLQLLDLNQNLLGGTIPELFQELSSLRVLFLRSNKFEGEVPAWVWRLPRLQIIDLSRNAFKGRITSNAIVFGGMSNASMASTSLVIGLTLNVDLTFTCNTNGTSHVLNVTASFTIGVLDQPVFATIKGVQTAYSYVLPTLAYVDLSMNEFTGEIPWRLGTLQVLIQLNVSDNQFTSSLSDNLGSLFRLESLDVSYNNLSSPNPSSFLGLGFLEVLRMGGNNLSGPIPNGVQFQSFDGSSYRPGNPGLCGALVDVQCFQNVTFNYTRSFNSTETHSSGTGF